MKTPAYVENTDSFGRPIETKGSSKLWWLLGVGAFSLVVLIGAGIFWAISTFQGALSEVSDMGPWPGSDIAASRVIQADLSHLGLDRADVYKMPADTMPGVFIDDAGVNYYLGDRLAATVAVFKYEDADSSSSAFRKIPALEWRACGESVFFNIGDRGSYRCTNGDTQQRSYRNESWVVKIVAFNTTGRFPSDLAELIRDALSDNWASIHLESGNYANAPTHAPRTFTSG